MSNSVILREGCNNTMIFYEHVTHNEQQPMLKIPSCLVVFIIHNGPNSSFSDRWINQHIVKTGHFTGSGLKSAPHLSRCLTGCCVGRRQTKSNLSEDVAKGSMVPLKASAVFLKPASLCCCQRRMRCQTCHNCIQGGGKKS